MLCDSCNSAIHTEDRRITCAGKCAACQTEQVCQRTPAEVNRMVWISAYNEDFRNDFFPWERRAEQSALGQQGSLDCGGSHFLGAQSLAAYLICCSFSESTPGSSCSWEAASGTFKMELIGCCLDLSELNVYLPPFPRCQGAEGGGWHPAVMFCCRTEYQTLHFCSRPTSMSKLLFLSAWATDVSSYNWSHMGTTSCCVATALAESDSPL